MSEPAVSRRIIPDVDQSVSAQHLRYRKGPPVWPLWLAFLALIGLFAAAANGIWYERQRLLAEVSELSGEVSNMHARLDSGETQSEDAITLLQAQIGTLFQEQDQLGMTVSDTRSELLSLIPASEDTVSADALIELTEQIKVQLEAAAERDRQLTDLDASLETLAQTSKQARDQLANDIESLFSRLDDQEGEVSDTMAALREEQLALQNRVQAIDDAGEGAEIVTADEMMQQIDTTQQTLQEELDALESDLRQIRQAQLAFSAQLEMLR